jgi:hypothetical protein
MGPEHADEVRRLAAEAPYLGQVLLFENGQNLSGDALAYQKLGTGALDEALSAVAADDENHPRLVRLVAASRGATDAQRAAARDLPAGAGIDYHTLWAALGLAAREKADTTSLVARMKEFDDPEELAGLEQFLHPERLAHDAAAARAALTLLGPSARGHAYVLGITILGDAAPEAWRTEARALLFAPERPFF